MNTTEQNRKSAGAGGSLAPLLPRYALLLALWVVTYRCLEPATKWITTRVFGLALDTHAGSAVYFLLFEAPKVLMLLALIVFVVGVIRSFFSAERTRQMLTGRREFTGNILAALLGVPTPFCSCSAVPLFMGFVQAGVPLGVTLSFLIAAPMVNEVALGMLFTVFGLKIACLYVACGLTIATLAGWIVGRLKMERYVEAWVYEMQAAQCCLPEDGLTWAGRIEAGESAVREIVGKVWLYVLLGIGVGAAIHGYIPADRIVSVMGRGIWWGVPAAVLIGVPMYSNAAAVLPVVQVLIDSGAAKGTALAFMMAVIALSMPEMVILRKVLKPRLIAVFAGVVALGITIVGYAFNALLK